MKKNEPVRKIMTANPVTVQVGQKPSDVLALLAERKFHHLPVLNGKKLVGMISVTDVLRQSWGNPLSGETETLGSLLDHSMKLEEMMSSTLATLSPDETVREAAIHLSSGGFHSLPVVEDGNLVGIVTSTDLIQYLLEQY